MSSLIRADSVAIPLADDSVDLIITSPPYFALRSYTDQGEHYDGQIGSEPTPHAFLEALWAVTAECRQVLKPTGSMWVNLGDKYAGGGTSGGPSQLEGATQRRVAPRRPPTTTIPAKSLMGLPWRYAIGCIDQLGLILRAEVIWSKPNGLPESVTDRVRRSHEQWFHFTKEPRYFAAVDEVREAQVSPPQVTKSGQSVHRSRGRVGLKDARDQTKPTMAVCDAPNPLGKLPGSVWEIPSEPLKVPEHIGVDHFAAFPQEWPRRIILGWSPSGVCVVCGEGRRPVVDATPIIVKPSARRLVAQAEGNAQRTSTSGTMVEPPKRTITGYACACPDTTAPTKPAVVLDPFVGTGTVPMVARALGRYGIGIDLSADYLRLAKWRVFQSGHAAKTRERTNREAQGQML